MSTDSTFPAPPPPPTASLARSLAESLVSLLIAVILFRTFLAEGYMISTGSMAPTLLGYHKRVNCPTCQTEFPFGVAYDTDDLEAAEEDDARRHRAVCPNCGQTGILVGDVPRNHGDQLLVFKQSYLHRSPRRWEVIVFRNPADPLEAFVKRTVGLPGETVQVIDGNLYVNGELCRKDFAQQREMRIPVHHHHAVPETNRKVRPHWIAEVAEGSDESDWEIDGDGFRLVDAELEDVAWINYAHWIRRGGQHQTSVKLANWPREINPQSVPPAGLRYDQQTHRLSCIGALPEPDRDNLISLSNRPDFQEAVRDLYEQSHISPIHDFYGYNSADQQQPPAIVRDLMWSAEVEVRGGRGEFRVEMSTGPQDFAAVFDFDRGDVRLHVDEHEIPALTGGLPSRLAGGAARLEMSLFDQQVVIAVDGIPVMPAYEFRTAANGVVTRHPLRFGARGLKVRVDDITVYRDVHYTTHQTKHAAMESLQLGPDEYFVLGDNSPVSHDSRRWEAAPVNRHLLVGKPFVVHLPSKPRELHIGDRVMQLRVPDVERVRLLK